MNPRLRSVIPSRIAVMSLSALALAGALTGCLQDQPAGPAQSDRNELTYAALTGQNFHRSNSGVIPRDAAPTLMDPSGNRDDWTHYGLSTATTVSRKAGTLSGVRINMTSVGSVLGFAPPTTYPHFKWTNGASPNTSISTPRGIRVASPGHSFTVTIPATGVPKEAYIYVSLYKAHGELTIRMSDGSGGTASHQFTDNAGTTTYWFKIVFRNQNTSTLNLTWKMLTNYGGGLAILHGASYGNYANTAPTAVLAQPQPPSDGLFVKDYTEIPFSVNSISADPDGILGVEYWRSTRINGVDDLYKMGETTTPPYNLVGYKETVGGTHSYYAIVVDRFGMGGGTNAITLPVWGLAWYNGQPVTIPDKNTAGAVISTSLSNMQGLIREVRVIADVTHPWVGDLVLGVGAPGGALRTMASRLGDSGDNYRNTQFNDLAPLSITQGLPPFTGSYRPVQTLGIFANGTANGTWSLKALDQSSGYVGTLNDVRVFVRTSVQ